MTDADLLASKLAAIETCVQELQRPDLLDDLVGRPNLLVGAEHLF